MVVYTVTEYSLSSSRSFTRLFLYGLFVIFSPLCFVLFHLSNYYECISILLILIADNLWKTVGCSISTLINWFAAKTIINEMAIVFSKRERDSLVSD